MAMLGEIQPNQHPFQLGDRNLHSKNNMMLQIKKIESKTSLKKGSDFEKAHFSS